MELSTKLEVLAEFLSCANVTFWHFDKEMSLLSTNTESDNLFQALFAISDNKQTLHQYSLENQMPGFCSDAALLWLVCPRHVNGVLADVYVIGPVFGSETSEQSLIQSLQALNIPPGMVLSDRYPSSHGTGGSPYDVDTIWPDASLVPDRGQIRTRRFPGHFPRPSRPTPSHRQKTSPFPQRYLCLGRTNFPRSRGRQHQPHLSRGNL